jgi:AcrR family transcriptional regulator
MELEAVAVVLAAHPNATMAELARAAKVSRATLHRRFPSRDVLVGWLAEAAATGAVEAVRGAQLDEGGAGEACGRLVAALVPLGGRFEFLLRGGDWIERLPAVGEQVGQLTAAVDGLIERGRADGTFRLDLPASYQARLVLAAVFTGWEAVRNGELGAKEAPAAASAALLGGLAT